MFELQGFTLMGRSCWRKLHRSLVSDGAAAATVFLLVVLGSATSWKVFWCSFFVADSVTIHSPNCLHRLFLLEPLKLVAANAFIALDGTISACLGLISFSLFAECTCSRPLDCVCSFVGKCRAISRPLHHSRHILSCVAL